MDNLSLGKTGLFHRVLLASNIRGRTPIQNAPNLGDVYTRNEAVSCTDCGWTTTWAHYHRSYKGKRIHGGRAYPAFLAFTTEFKKKQSPRQKLMAIDRLVHSIHEAMVHASAATPGSVNLIEGKGADILKLLDDLAYGDTTEAARPMREDFKKKMQEAELARKEHQQAVDARRAKRLSERSTED